MNQPPSNAGRLAAVWALASIVFVGYAGAQGLVTGVVLDAPSRQPIEGVTVVLAGTLHGTVTGPDGVFSLGPVPEGEFTLRVMRAGYEPVEIKTIVPGNRIVLHLGKERPELGENALGPVGRGFELGSFAERGDPIQGDPESGMRRVPGVDAVRYGTALSSPIVRGLVAGRTDRISNGLPSMGLDVPGVGRIDLSDDRDFQGGTVYHGMAQPAISNAPAVVWSSPDPFASPAFSSVSIESGYQTNMSAYQSSGRFRGTISDTRYRVHASHGAGAGYNGASGVDVAASYQRTSAGIAIQHELTPATIVRVSGRLAGARSMEIPGADMDLDAAGLAGVSVSLQTTPERSVLRRITGSVAISESDISLESAEGSGDAYKRSSSAVVMADLYHSQLESLQTGLRVGHDRYRGWISGLDSPGSQPSFFWPDVRVTSGDAFVSLGKSGLATSVSLSGRVGVARYEAVADESTLQDISAGDKTDVLGGLAAVIVHRRSRTLRVHARISATGQSPSVLQRYSVALPPVDGPRTIQVGGTSGLAPEWTYSIELGAREKIGGVVVSVRPFYSFIRNFVAARPPSVAGGQPSQAWSYRNGSADFWGFELSASYVPLPFVSVSAHLDYTRATDRRLEEPPPNVPPLSGRVDFTAASPGERILIEFSSEFAFATDRVAARIAEPPADGYLLFHWWLGLPVSDRISFRVGAYNLFNRRFEPHPGLYARGGSDRIPGPGRSWLFTVRLTA